MDFPQSVDARFSEAAAVLLSGQVGIYIASSDEAENVSLIAWTYAVPVPLQSDVTATLLQIDFGKLRAARMPLLEASDTIAVRCFKAGQEFPFDWQTYTQALRDITKVTDPLNVVWPTAPATPSGI